MKRTMILATVLMLVLTMAVPAFAAENDFVPSITYKPDPEVVTETDEAGNEVVGTIVDEAEEVVDTVEEGCLIITPIADALDEEEPVHPEVRELLLYVYEALNTEEMQIPYEKLVAELEDQNMVVRDLFDIRWDCIDHPDMLALDSNNFEITFDLGVEPGVEVYAMTYDEETGDWEPVVKTVNNGDGTVTCTFAHFCVVAFSVAVAPAQTTSFPWGWLVVLAVAAVGLVVVIVKRRSKKEQNVA